VKILQKVLWVTFLIIWYNTAVCSTQTIITSYALAHQLTCRSPVLLQSYQVSIPQVMQHSVDRMQHSRA